MRPGGHPAGPFTGLAEALVSDLALPELLSARQDAAPLARHLRAAADDPAFAIVGALDEIEAAGRNKGDLLAIETARLALVVDQLEELFTTAEVTADDRLAFVRCLDRLAQSGRVFVDRDQNPRDRIAGFRVLQLMPGIGPTSAQRVLDHIMEAADPIEALASGATGWPAELEAVRLWYEPHLDRIHKDAVTRCADLIQLEQIAGGYPSRQRFLTELTLDPPDATSD
jgi:hypothetical protein